MSLFSLFTLLLLIMTTTGSPEGEGLIPSLKSKNLKSVHLPSPDPEIISVFSATNISLLFTIPNSLIPSISSNSSAASAWLSTYVAPFIPHVRSAISVGDNVKDANLIKLLVPAIHNVKEKVEELGFEWVKVSTTISSGFNVRKELLCRLSEINVTTLFVSVSVLLGPTFKEVVSGGFVFKRDFSSDVIYVSLGDGDYGVVEVKVLKVKVKKHDDYNKKKRGAFFFFVAALFCILCVLTYRLKLFRRFW